MPLSPALNAVQQSRSVSEGGVFFLSDYWVRAASSGARSDRARDKTLPACLPITSCCVRNELYALQEPSVDRYFVESFGHTLLIRQKFAFHTP